MSQTRATGWWDAERDGIALRRRTNGDAVMPMPAMDGAAGPAIHPVDK
jgi:hypothetical protein